MRIIASNRLPQWGATVLRAVVGLMFIAHGAQKLFGEGFGGVAGMMKGLGIPFPTLAAVVLIIVELAGGAALTLGLFTRLAAVPLAFSMLVATLMVHLPNGFFAREGGIEYTLLLTVACVALAMMGPGEAALDRVLAQRGLPFTREQEARHSKASPRETATGGVSVVRNPNHGGNREEKQSSPYLQRW
jgi:putative oxidoreductase